MLRRFYHALPIPAYVRHRIGQLRRRWMSARGPLTRLPGIRSKAGAVGLGATAHRFFDPPREGVPDYLFFGVIDWHFRHQRPQQLATAIARQGRRVFYISVNFVDAPRPGISTERVDPQLPIYQIHLHVSGPLNVYATTPSRQQAIQLKRSLRELLLHACVRSAVSVIQHPFWDCLGADFPTARTVYDCIDHHAGFSNTAPEYVRLEQRLLSRCDLVVATSTALEATARSLARRVEVIRNAGDYDHFHRAAVSHDAERTGHVGKRVVGYYGAIAEWFDVELLDQLARALPDCEFRLIGADTAGVGHSLRNHANVRMIGERPYAELPRWLADFDVCLIPFRMNSLTLATNPVKIYEYLSAGRPVVSSDLPEIRQFGDLVYRASTVEQFVERVVDALGEADDAHVTPLRARRMDFARKQTWQHRAVRFVECAEQCSDEPSVSVVVVSYNQWQLTRRCLASLEECSDGTPLQVIVVDNASTDETQARLREWSEVAPARRLAILNADNLGFGGAVNVGMTQASGEYLVVLNNDTILSPGWARGLRRHFENDPGLGLICPVTNNIGNEAQVALEGASPEEVSASARYYTLGKTGETLPLSVAAFFCVMMPRSVWERTGALDERFFPGFFEDDDYCMRVRANGWRIGCAEDVFVYHELSATFNAEGMARRQSLFDRNRKLFEEKWGPWRPHTYRRESLPR